MSFLIPSLLVWNYRPIFVFKYKLMTLQIPYSALLLMHGEAGGCSALLTSAFDTVDHHIMLDGLGYRVGVLGSTLEWFSSHPSKRSFSVAAFKYSSSSTSLAYYVPQGTVWGLSLFLLHLLPLQRILNTFKYISYHCYADDIHLYISFKPQDFLSYRSCLAA